MFNQCIIEGRLVKDPDKTTTTKGTKAVIFAIANKRSENTLFFDCVAYGRTAEFIASYFKKGSPIIITGPISYYDSEKDGKKYRNYNITAVAADFTVSKQQASGTEENTDGEW